MCICIYTYMLYIHIVYYSLQAGCVQHLLKLARRGPPYII